MQSAIIERIRIAAEPGTQLVIDLAPSIVVVSGDQADRTRETIDRSEKIVPCLIDQAILEDVPRVDCEGRWRRGDVEGKRRGGLVAALPQPGQTFDTAALGIVGLAFPPGIDMCVGEMDEARTALTGVARSGTTSDTAASPRGFGSQGSSQLHVADNVARNRRREREFRIVRRPMPDTGATGRRTTGTRLSKRISCHPAYRLPSTVHHFQYPVAWPSLRESDAPT